MKTESNDKKVYNSPEIKDLGEIGQVTASNTNNRNTTTPDTVANAVYFYQS